MVGRMIATAASAPPAAIASPDLPTALLRGFADLLPELRLLSVEALPESARPLLDHEGGMTAALERAWGGPLSLQVLRSRLLGDRLTRAVILWAGGTGSSLSGAERESQAAELGLISIHLDALPPPVRQDVQFGDIPFGRLLADAGIEFRSRPSAFFETVADATLSGLLQVSAGQVLFGRTTRLSDAAGRVLADAIEILGQSPDQSASDQPATGP